MLIRPPWRIVAGVAIVAGLAVLAGLAIVVYHGTTTRFDTWVYDVSLTHMGETAKRVSIDASSPLIGVTAMVLAAVCAAMARRADAVVLCLTPLLGIALELWVLKPLIGRHETSYGIPPGSPHLLSYPSGHETGVTCTALVLFVLLCQTGVHLFWKLAALPVLLAWTALVAVGLVRNHWHYATDTFGAFGLALAVVLGSALAIDGITALTRPTGNGRHHAQPAARGRSPQLTPRP